MSLDFLKPKEKFLILEISPKGTDGIFLDIDEDRNLIFKKFQKNIDIKKYLKLSTIGLSQKSFEGKYILKPVRKIIAGVDSSLATTISVPVEKDREDFLKNNEITFVEFENLFSQTMASVISKCKSEASLRLGVENIDTILVSAKVVHFKIDSEPVESPISLIGNKISFVIDLTFTTRKVFEEFKGLFSAPEEFFFIESPNASLRALKRVRKLPLALIVLGEEDSWLYVLAKGNSKNDVLYREKFNWAFSSLFDAIQKDFSVGSGASKELYEAYIKNKMSKMASRVFKKTIDPIFELFLKEIKNKKIQNFVYLDSKYDLPYELPFKVGKVSVSNIPISEILSDVDFSLNIKADDHKGFIFGHLSPFIEAFFDKDVSNLNKKIRKRLHWLVE
jgi:hypothetical protein